MTLRSLLAYDGDVGSVWHCFAITVESLWVYKGPLSKNIPFPTGFDSFMKRRRLTCRIEKQISLMIISIRMRFGCIFDPFWLRFGSVLQLSGLIECKFASDRPQVAPKSAHKQIKHILPKDFRVAGIWESSHLTGNQLRATSNVTSLPIHLISSSRWPHLLIDGRIYL